MTVLSAQEMLRALYPELTGKNYIMSVTTFGSFDMPWTSMPPFDVEIGPVEMGHMEIVGSGKSSPATERHPVLAAHFEFGRDNILDQVSFRSPEAALEIENDRIRKQVDSHQGWSDKEIAEALKGAGAKFGPNEGADLLRVVPLNVLEPFIGSMHIDSTEFRLRHQQKPRSLADLYWIIVGHATLGAGHADEWSLICEPFEGKIVWITRTRLAPVASQKQQSEYAQQAELDSQGNIFVSSDQGKLIWMGNANQHCLELLGAADRQTMGCSVKQDLAQGNSPESSMSSLQLEIYRRDGHKQIIQPGAPILEWHFWKNGDQVAVYSGLRSGEGTYALYDSSTGRRIAKLAAPADEALLPQWAKSRGELDDESVPTSIELTRERMKWVAKALRQIGKIRPGTRREDLLKTFTTEGGLSFPTQQTYVYIECPYIKVDVRFKPVNDERNDFKESPNDIIEFISKPYLAWSVSD